MQTSRRVRQLGSLELQYRLLREALQGFIRWERGVIVGAVIDRYEVARAASRLRPTSLPSPQTIQQSRSRNLIRGAGDSGWRERDPVGGPGGILEASGGVLGAFPCDHRRALGLLRSKV